MITETVGLALNKAFNDWKGISPIDGKKFVYFEHHCEVFHGMKFDYDYQHRTFRNFAILDEGKYTLFLLKYA